MFTNLLNNAIKFAPEDSIVLFKAWYEKDKLIFLVEDSGPGIPPEDLGFIFTDFFRASNVGDSPGAGLGLSIARHMVEAHGGHLWVESQEGVGSTFFFSIPIA